MQRTRHKFHPHAAFRHSSPASDAAGALRPPVACLVRIKSDLIAAGADLALTVRSMRPVADTRPRRSQQSVGHHLRLPLQVQMWRWWRPSTAMMGPPLQCGSRQGRRRWRRDPSQSVVGREARRYLLSRPEHRRRVGEDVQLVVWRVLHMLGIHHAIPVQRRYPLHPVLVRAGRELRLVVRCARRLRTRQGGVSRHLLLRRRPRIMELGEVVQRLRTALAVSRWRLLFAVIVHVESLVAGHGRVGERHQLVEHREFQFELDAVHHRFHRRLDLVVVRVLHPK